MVVTENAVSIIKYSPKHKATWDNFVSASKNGVFLFYRDYMEYHAERFEDSSLLFFKNGKLVGLLPANLQDSVLNSHEGLTFGGIISCSSMNTALMMEIFEELPEYCQNQGITRILYKAVPHIYHIAPSEEDLYALFRHRAKLEHRAISSSINLPLTLKYDCNRKRLISKAVKNGLVVKRCFEFNLFMKMVEEGLMEYHEAKPVHTAAEIDLLAERFPDNIKLFASFRNKTMLAGIIVYENANVAKSQYGMNSTEGRLIGAEDLIFDYLINDYYKNKKYFDFGTSVEKSSNIPNNGLLRYKEGFGARTIVYDCYEIPLQSN